MHRRVTYGAATDYLNKTFGRAYEARTIMAGHDKDPLHSRVVSSDPPGLPTGYAKEQLAKDLLKDPLVNDAEELKRVRDRVNDG